MSGDEADMICTTGQEFMSDEQFLGYMELQSMTERHRFNREQMIRLAEMAKAPLMLREGVEWFDEYGEKEIESLVMTARVYLNQRTVRSFEDIGIELPAKTLVIVHTGPIPMILRCPECLAQHIDVAEAPNKYCLTDKSGECISAHPKCPHQPNPEPLWTNPPHKTHLCQVCGNLWKPANVHTTGVSQL